MEANATEQRNIFTRKIRAGKRTYFFDVKSTKFGADYFIVITESRRMGAGAYEKHKLFLYKEDFGKFLETLSEVISRVEQRRFERFHTKGTGIAEPSAI